VNEGGTANNSRPSLRKIRSVTAGFFYFLIHFIKGGNTMFKEKMHLRLPGPSPVPLRVQHAITQPMIGHRGSEFSELLKDTTNRLRPIFGTAQSPFVLTGSGTSALETAVANVLQPGDEALFVVTGDFGERFAAIARTYGATVHELNIEWGKACDPAQLEAALDSHPNVKAVFATYSETSTAVLNPVKELAKVVREKSDALFIVDGVSAIGGARMLMDEWGIDIVATGSQKALMLPPGLAFLAVSERAWQVIEATKAPRYYFDLRKFKKNLEKFNTPSTPAVSLIFGLKEVLNMIEEEGLDNVYRRHERLRDMTIAGVQALGLPIFNSLEHASPTVTAVSGIDAAPSEEIRGMMRKTYNITLAGGQKHLKGQLFRIGHMGFCDENDIIIVIAGLEMTLKKLGLPIELGQGVKAAQEVAMHV
jgi:aspartate aminotransferase-like enzyme